MPLQMKRTAISSGFDLFTLKSSMIASRLERENRVPKCTRYKNQYISVTSGHIGVLDSFEGLNMGGIKMLSQSPPLEDLVKPLQLRQQARPKDRSCPPGRVPSR